MNEQVLTSISAGGVIVFVIWFAAFWQINVKNGKEKK